MMPVGMIAPARPVPTLKSIVTGLSLPAPDLVLDAGDPASVGSTSPSTWVDVQNGYNFDVEPPSSANPPTFSGGVGSLDSAFTLGSVTSSVFRELSDYTFAEAWHKNNAAFTVAALIYVPTWIATSPNKGAYLFSTCDGATSSIGVRSMARKTSGLLHLSLDVSKGSGGYALSTNTDMSAYLVESAWNFVAIAIDEATGATGLTFFANGGVVQTSGVYSSPSAAASSGPYDVSGPTGATSGNRIKMFAGWSSRLSTTQLGDLYTQIKLTRQFDLP